MGIYSLLVKPLVRDKDMERASRIALRFFQIAEKLPLGRAVSRILHGNKPEGLQREIFGLQFYNPVGLGAGLDIKGRLYNDLNLLGFSFVEIGPMDADGMRKAVLNIQKDPQNDILAACINADFLTAFTIGYDFCDFFVIDISKDPDTDLLEPLLDARLAEDVYRPVVAKIPEWLSQTELEDLIDYSLMNGVDGIEVRTLEQVRYIYERSKGRLPIIANSHIDSPELASAAIEAGADLVEVRSGLVREGPGFVGKILRTLLEKSKNGNTQSEAGTSEAIDAS